MNIYLISGLGADRRIFSKLDLNGSVHYLDWIDFDTKDSIKNYALKLSKSINTNTPFAIIGVSFGGMLAVEISKYLPAKKVFIISSMEYSNNIPKLYKIGNLFNLYKIVPSRFFKISWINNLIFGMKTNEEKQLLKNILKVTDNHFLKWAIGAILKWKNSISGNNIVHIHGSKDLLLPIKEMSPDYIIENGGHLMIFQKSKEISEIINNELNTLKVL